MTSSNFNSSLRAICILALVAGTLTAHVVRADEAGVPADDRGLFIGINAGFGGSAVQYKQSSRSIFTDPTDGALGAVRFGYAFSSKLALSLEGAGFGGSEDRDDDWGLGAGLLALTWHPGGGGFFLRAGVGGGGGEFIHPDTGQKITLTDRGAWLFGLGYDWRLGTNTSLGLAIDSLMLDAGGATGFEHDQVGASGLTVQFNWHL